MSCAIMFHPCISGSGIEAKNIGLESSRALTLSTNSSHLRPGHTHHTHESLTAHTAPHLDPSLDQLRSQHIRSARARTPPTHMQDSARANKKMCTVAPSAVTSQLPVAHNNHMSPADPTTSPSLSSPAPMSPCRNESITHDVKYLSANCVVVTHYRGDTSAVVDEHFQRALQAAKGRENTENSLKISSRNFPASFYQPHLGRPSFGLAGGLGAHSASDLYEAYHGGLHPIQGGGDPWSYSFSPTTYAAHRSMGHDMYHSAMSSASHPYQYSSLGFQQPFARIPSVPVPTQMSKSDAWNGRYYDTFGGAPDLCNGAAAAAAAYSSSHYHNVAGLDSGMTQDCAKDLYWLQS